MEIIFETNRLILKVFEAADLEDTKCFWGNDEVMLHCGGATPIELLPKVIAAYAKCYREYGLSVFAVVEKKSAKIIGAAGFNIGTSLEKVELIYHFAKDYWGKGYATEAAAACLGIAKANGNVKIIFASADPLHADSLKILEKIGFVYQGMKFFEDTEQEEPYYELVLE